MHWYQMENKKIEEATHSDIENGLTSAESRERLRQNGPNEIADSGKRSPIMILLTQFKDFMVIVLLAATVLSGLLGEYLDAIAIILIVMLNGILGFIQERKAEKSLDALRELSAPMATVLRDKEWQTIPAKELVVGDMIKISSGDRVSADIRLIETHGLLIEESALTGESISVQKGQAPLEEEELSLGDQVNMGFMGTMVTQGNGTGIVVNTGMKTEMGKIASLIQNAETLQTPLQIRLEQLGKILIMLAVVLTVLVVGIGVLHGHGLTEMVLSGVSLAVAAIPEGLPAIVTIALALGVQKMIKRNAIVRKLPSVETLGCATVICTDKTGTLTQNKMTVTHLWAEGQTWELAQKPNDPPFLKEGHPAKLENESSLRQLLSYAVLCNDSELVEGEDNAVTEKGDPTEIALLISGQKAGFSKQGLLSNYKIIKSFPFDSTRKMMSVIIANKKGEKFVLTKGAPDVLLDRCDHILWNKQKQLIKKRHEEHVKEAILSLGNQALRTIAVAFKPLRSDNTNTEAEQLERGLTFVGVQGMIDPPRPEVKASIANCQRAGVKTVMITGDHVVTASAIARQLNLLPQDGQVMDGATLSKMTEEELIDQVDDIYVYARVAPEHKLKIVKALQKKGHIVAMTGDGVNDAPAIKAANIGIAMGNTGTDVAKEASSLILSDDNFATIEAAIEEGRNIYENIRKFIRYLLASNVGEILVMFFAMILSLPLPLLPIQILWVNLVTDGLPAMALGVDAAEDNVMRQGPRKPNEGVFARGMGWKIISRGFLIGIVTLIGFWTILHGTNDLTKAQNVAFMTLVMSQLIQVFDCRSERSIFDRNPFGNRYLVLAVLSSIVLMLGVMYIPFFEPIFHTVPLSLHDWLLIVGLSAIPTLAFSGAGLFGQKEKEKSPYTRQA
ncbi:Ca2+-transporting ATPase [Pullulanibacillus pueri]|uniref:P-type Ca(2+) transporter n=1 Tax=Pullulanibacillus pueri TaxID=1437324 RepID=A0A8J3EN00_9BACL|nr:calcium-translocating P-type ATPase, SERCA-type [Pullulanibacillus pueri]MBM7683864.1 Ca2+-transporting ATPase [Pullulanibacillus pueri]GGH84599.1 calcium-translocating P-type ATPase, SERCA-type [Pullulanibacillus pueri]